MAVSSCVVQSRVLSMQAGLCRGSGQLESMREQESDTMKAEKEITEVGQCQKKT